MHATQTILTIVSGGIVGLSLGLLGGGGSILAVPLLLYVVGIHDPHVVIGTTALAVALNAYINLIPHWRAGHVHWRAAILFAIPGALGAFVGSSAGKIMHGKELLFLFALLMIVVAVLMLRHKSPARTKVAAAAPDTPVANPVIAPISTDLADVHVKTARVVPAGFLVGAISGFFGIGGGFLIVPGLVFSTGMPMIVAIGSSLFAVGTFGLTTAVNYALSGLVNWLIMVEYVAGGVLGGILGAKLATRLSHAKNVLNYIFAGVIFVVALYMIYMNLHTIHG